jgi:hypothetical protein
MWMRHFCPHFISLFSSSCFCLSSALLSVTPIIITLLLCYYKLNDWFGVHPLCRGRRLPMTESRRRPRADRGQIRLQPRDQDGMLVIGQQSAFRRDQMARYLGRRAQRATKKPGEIGPTTLQDIIDRWCTLGWVQTFSRSTTESDWLYLTAAGLRALNLPYNPWTPKPGSQFDHMFWVNEVRLLLEDIYPEGRWVSERHTRHYRTLTHYPDGEFYPAQATTAIAIEVERSLKDSERLERILPWLVARYGTTWYFAVEHDVLVRVRTKREALSSAHQERLFISHYDEDHQRWQTDLRQASPRSTPVEPDQERSEPEPPRTEQPADSEVLREIEGEWAPPKGNQLGSKHLPLLYPRHLPQTFEDAVKVATRLLTDWDKAMLREMQGCTHSELLWEWSQRLQEQLGLHSWQSSLSWGVHENRALWDACGKRHPAEIIFHLTEEVWRQFQGSPLPGYSRQLVLAESLSPLPRAEWPSTLEEAIPLARSLLSPFEVLWLHGHHTHDTWYGEKFPLEGWKKNLRAQFGLQPPQGKGDWEWNRALWLAAETQGKPIEEQRREVEWLLWRVTHEVVWGLDREARDEQPPESPQAKSAESQPWGRFSPGVTSDVSAQESQVLPEQSKLSLVGCMGLLGGLSALAGVVLLVLGGLLHTIVPGMLCLVLGLAVGAVAIYLAARY